MAAATEAVTEERRRHLRFPLALEINVHLNGRPDPVAVKMVDIAAQGVRFRLAGGRVAGSVRLEQRAAFGFVSPGHHVCVASGTVMRVVAATPDADSGPADPVAAESALSESALSEFVLAIDRANDAFHGFLGSLSA